MRSAVGTHKYHARQRGATSSALLIRPVMLVLPAEY